MAAISKAQIDRLGDRMREGDLTPDDVRLLDDYRLSFGEPYETCVRTIREGLQLEPTGRPAKSTTSLVEKLRRESIRLTQVQDIAGCRLVISDAVEQERVVASLRDLFPQSSIVDRRAVPSHGYRAVHVVVEISGKLIEIQVRSSLQHLWAELSEKLSDVADPAIKYGGGGEEYRQILEKASASVALIEKREMRIATLALSPLGAEILAGEEIASLIEQMAAVKRETADLFKSAILKLRRDEEANDIPN